MLGRSMMGTIRQEKIFAIKSIISASDLGKIRCLTKCLQCLQKSTFTFSPVQSGLKKFEISKRFSFFIIQQSKLWFLYKSLQWFTFYFYLCVFYQIHSQAHFIKGMVNYNTDTILRYDVLPISQLYFSKFWQKCIGRLNGCRWKGNDIYVSTIPCLL